MLCQLVIKFSRNRLFDFFDGACEHSFFARQVFGLVFFWEGYSNVLLFFGFHTNQLLFKARDELTGTQNQWEIFARAAVKGFAVDFTNEIHDNLVAVFRFGTLAAGFEVLRGLGQLAKRFFHVRIFWLHNQLFQLDGFQINFWDLWQSFVGHVDNNIVAFFPLFAVLHFDLWLQRRTITGFFKVAAHRAVDGLLHRFAQNTLAELLFQQRHRHFAFAEALHFNVWLCFSQFFVDLRVQLICGQRDGIAALQAFIQGLGDLHCIVLLST